MEYKEAYEGLKKQKVETIANSSYIKVGLRELNKALKALEECISLSKEYEVTEKAPYYDSWYCPECGDYVEPCRNYCPHCRIKLLWSTLWNK